MLSIVHGGDLTEAIARHGGTPQQWLDLSTGINPWPWPIPPDLPPAVWQRLPSRADQDLLIASARAAYRVPGGVEIAIAPGTQALIQWMPRLAAPGPVAIMGPTYGEHALTWQLAGHEVVAWDDPGKLPEGVRHAVIVNPNNPDGRVVSPDAIVRLAARLADRGGWLILDEAFADVEPTVSAVARCEGLPIVILRSFGKFYGLAGLRLGFAVGAPDIVQRIVAALGPWSCSGPALHIGALALADRQWADGTRDRLKRQANKLDDVLARAGFEVVGGTSLFRLARHRDAQKRHATLARQHIWCRCFERHEDLLRFGLPPDEAGLHRLSAAFAEGE